MYFFYSSPFSSYYYFTSYCLVILLLKFLLWFVSLYVFLFLLFFFILQMFYFQLILLSLFPLFYSSSSYLLVCIFSAFVPALCNVPFSCPIKTLLILCFSLLFTYVLFFFIFADLLLLFALISFCSFFFHSILYQMFLESSSALICAILLVLFPSFYIVFRSWMVTVPLLFIPIAPYCFPPPRVPLFLSLQYELAGWYMRGPCSCYIPPANICYIAPVWARADMACIDILSAFSFMSCHSE
jgi:hypothetical protein